MEDESVRDKQHSSFVADLQSDGLNVCSWYAQFFGASPKTSDNRPFQVPEWMQGHYTTDRVLKPWQPIARRLEVQEAFQKLHTPCKFFPILTSTAVCITSIASDCLI